MDNLLEWIKSNVCPFLQLSDNKFQMCDIYPNFLLIFHEKQVETKLAWIS